MSNVITHSRTSIFCACPWKDYLKHECNIHPAIKEESQGRSEGKQGHEYLAIGTPIKVVDDKTARLAGVLQAYEAHYGADGMYPGSEHEKGFAIPFAFNDEWTLAGVADVVTDSKVVDHKFYSKQNQFLHDGFSVNSQRIYLSAFERDVFEFNVIIKPQIRLKKNQSLEEYQVECCEKMLADRGNFFSRIELYFDENQIHEMIEWYALIVVEIERCRKTGIWRKNYSSCTDMWGRCEYYSYCHNYSGKHELALQNGYEVAPERTHEELKKDGLI